MDLLNFLLEDEFDDYDEDIQVINEAEEDDALASVDDATKGIEETEEETTENNEDETKQNNNDDETDTEEGVEETTDTEGEESDSAEDLGNDEENPDSQEGMDETEPEDEVSKSKRLFFYENFENLYNTTLSFLDKLDSIKDSLQEPERKEVIIELEKKLIKQKNDINFLLKKKIKTINEENLGKLLMYFSTKIETTIDITKSVIKEVK